MSDDDPRIDQPGLRRLRTAVAEAARRRLPKRSTLAADATAGLTVAVSQVPQGMANGLLAGVNPLYGLYANAIGPIVGGALTSSRLMVVNSTSAVALVAGQALIGVPDEARDASLFLMVMLAGALSVVLGLLDLGRITRFVSYSVMKGFIAGIAVVIVLSQLPTIMGVTVPDGDTLPQTLHLLTSLGETHLPTLTLAALTAILALGLPHIGLRNGASLIAVVVPTVVAAVAGLEAVAVVDDVGDIPTGVPAPFLPTFGDLSVEVVTGAFSVAMIVLIQGSGVSQSVPNPDGSPNASREFVAQGAANLAAGMFRGLPVGGSLAGTAVNLTSGAAGRWAGILSGVWMAVIVLAFPGAIAQVAMPALGVLLMIAGGSLLDPSEIVSVWRGGLASRLAGGTTFVATLFLPIQIAVGFGVALSVVLYISQSSTHIGLVELVKRTDGRIEERPPPKRLADDAVTVLHVYGPLFFAGARTLERRLPSAHDARRPAVVLRLRGRTRLGATLVDVLTDYAQQLADAGGRLYISGLSDDALDHLLRTKAFTKTGPTRVYEATAIIGESTQEAHLDAQEWIVEGDSSARAETEEADDKT